jgi:subtilase family serine protease
LPVSFSSTTECFEFYDLAPADFATIYNITPLRKGGRTVTGKGQSVTAIEDTDIHPKDWYTFRNVFGLSSYSGTFSQIHPAPPTGAMETKWKRP